MLAFSRLLPKKNFDEAKSRSPDVKLDDAEKHIRRQEHFLGVPDNFQSQGVNEEF